MDLRGRLGDGADALRFGRDAIVYPGHGPATTLGHELDTNPFLRELRVPE